MISNKTRALFRAKLLSEDYTILSELSYAESPIFVIEDDFLSSPTIDNLSRVCAFAILLMYYEDRLRLHIRLCDYV